eukprot:s4387_g4.t1
MAEIGFIGKAPGTYNMYLGADFVGKRLNTLYAESVNEDEIIKILTPLFSTYAQDKFKDERFGDYLIRTKICLAVVGAAALQVPSLATLGQILKFELLGGDGVILHSVSAPQKLNSAFPMHLFQSRHLWNMNENAMAFDDLSVRQLDMRQILVSKTVTELLTMQLRGSRSAKPRLSTWSKSAKPRSLT